MCLLYYVDVCICVYRTSMCCVVHGMLCIPTHAHSTLLHIRPHPPVPTHPRNTPTHPTPPHPTPIPTPQVRKEIGAFAWHSIAELPADREEGSQVYITDSGERHRFFMVWPYVKPLRRWIKNYKRRLSGGDAGGSGVTQQSGYGGG